MSFKTRTLIIITLLNVLASQSISQEMAVPLSLQFELFFKIMTFDRNLQKDMGDQLDFGILFQSKYRHSLNVSIGLQKQFQDNNLVSYEEIPINWIYLDISDQDDIRQILIKQNLDVLYIAPLRAVDVRSILNLTQQYKISTFTGVNEYVAQGVAISIGLKSEKPTIIINHKSSIKEGSDYSSKLLKLANIIE